VKPAEKRTKIRIEADPAKVLAFLETHGYPFTWHLETFQTLAISLRVEKGFPPETIAYVWAIWADVGVLDVHVCTARRFWLSRELLDRLYTLAELFGAHTIISTPHGDRAPMIRQLLANQGFERDGATMKKKLEFPIGYIRGWTEDPPGASDPADPASADPGECADARWR
jgi:hypothetical protein